MFHNCLPTASSPHDAVKFLIITWEQLSGSIPSVLGELNGALNTTSSNSRSVHAYGCMPQNGGFRTVTPVHREVSTIHRFYQTRSSIQVSRRIRIPPSVSLAIYSTVSANAAVGDITSADKGTCANITLKHVHD